MTTQKPSSQTGCAWIENCIEMCTDRSIFVEDQGVRATVLNPKQSPVRKIHYDGCYSTRKGIRQADYILGLPGIVDVIVELKGSDTNLKEAALQVESTLEAWKQDRNAAALIAALIVYGRIEGKKKLPGRVPRAAAVISGLTSRFLKSYRILLIIEENGTRQFRFNDFIQRTHAN
jgi:hypothetical protein